MYGSNNKVKDTSNNDKINFRFFFFIGVINIIFFIFLYFFVVRARFNIIEFNVPQEAGIYDQIKIEAVIKNKGFFKGIYNLNFKVDNEIKDSKILTIKGKEIKKINFNIEFHEDSDWGRHTIYLNDISKNLIINPGLAPKPKVGDMIVSNFSGNNNQIEVSEVILGEDVVNGKKCWINRGVFEPIYNTISVGYICSDKESLLPIKEKDSGLNYEFSTISNFNFLNNDTFWPLKIGRKITIKEENETESLIYGKKISSKKAVLKTYSIDDIEYVDTPVGKLKAFKINIKDENNKLIETIWQSPKVKQNIIKLKDYVTGYEQNIKSYDFDNYSKILQKNINIENYKLYQSSDYFGNILTLVDTANKIVKIQKVKNPMIIRAIMRNGFLLKEDPNKLIKDEQYWFMEYNGKLSLINKTAGQILLKDAGGSFPVEQIFEINEDDIIFSQCESNNPFYISACNIFRLNINSGKVKKLTPKNIEKNTEFYLSQVSTNKKIAYIVILIKDTEKFANSLLAKSEIKEIEYPTPTIISISTDTGKILKQQELINLKRSYYEKIWVSYDGNYATYILPDNKTPAIYNIKENNIKSIDLPSDIGVANWDGTGPIWSPDNKYILFDSIRFGENIKYSRVKEIIAYLDINKLSYKIIYESENEISGGDMSNFVKWDNLNTIQYTNSYKKSYLFNIINNNTLNFPLLYGDLLYKSYY